MLPQVQWLELPANYAERDASLTVDDATLRGGERRNLGCGCARLDGLLQMRSNR
jgi:hypothetical protein